MAKYFKHIGSSRAGLKVPPCGQTLEIPDGDHLWRKFMDSANHLIWNHDLGRMVPSHAALQFDPDLSSDWREHLELVHQQTASAIVGDDSRYTLVGQFPVGRVRKLDFVVTATPNSIQPFGCAHASVDWPPHTVPEHSIEPTRDVRKQLRNELAREASWVLGTPTVGPPAGA
jgi:hypothetical protein